MEGEEAVLRTSLFFLSLPSAKTAIYAEEKPFNHRPFLSNVDYSFLTDDGFSFAFRRASQEAPFRFYLNYIHIQVVVVG